MYINVIKCFEKIVDFLFLLNFEGEDVYALNSFIEIRFVIFLRLKTQFQFLATDLT